MAGSTCAGGLLVEASTLTLPRLELHLVDDLGKVKGISRMMLGQGEIDPSQLLSVECDPTSLEQEPLPLS